MAWRHLARAYYCRSRSWRPWPIDERRAISTVFARLSADANIMQIGSNDGVSGDPIHRHVIGSHHHLALVEPVPQNHADLVANYDGRDRTQIFNVAVSATGQQLTFFAVDNSTNRYPGYFDQLGSFSREMILQQSRDYPSIANDIVEMKVRCMSVDDIAGQAGFSCIDMLHVDAEGYDLDILETVDLERYKVRYLLFEHAHLDQTRYRDYLMRLRKSGYRLRDTGTDTLAIRHGGAER